MLKRILAMTVAMVLCACAALAEGLVDFGFYADQLSEWTDAKWTADASGSVQVLDLGDGLTISACLSGDQVMAVTVESPMEADSADAVRAALDALGCLSPEALDALAELGGGERTSDGGCVYGALEGELRKAVYAAAEADFADMVWQAVHGGSKYHAKPNCSGMDVARLITREAAAAMDCGPCDRCRPGA